MDIIMNLVRAAEMNRRRFSVMVLSVLVSWMLGGCASYKRFYQDETGGIDITKDHRFADAPTDPIVTQGANPQSDSDRMVEDGYVQIGYIAFNGRADSADEDDAFTQAKRVHAHRVLVYFKYRGTVSGTMPLTLPSTQTSTTSVYGNAYGPGGPSTFSGTGYTTTYGTQTTYIPYSVDRYDYLATFWTKRRSFVLGVYYDNLTPELRQALQTNKRVVVTVVVKGTPAFQADILRGDVLKAIGDTEIYDTASAQQAVESRAGQNVVIQIVRNGSPIQKEMRLNNPE